MNLTCIFFGILFIALGIWLGFLRGYRHIPAWKAMTDEEKNKINIKRLSLNVGEVIILSGIIFTLKGFGIFFTEHRFLTAMIAWLIIAGLDVWYIGKSKRYINKGGKTNGKKGKCKEGSCP